jgi:hypothetical protein
VGEDRRAAAYERLLSALTSPPLSNPAPPASIPAARVPLAAEDALEGEADIDAFLEEVLGSEPGDERAGRYEGGAYDDLLTYLRRHKLA